MVQHSHMNGERGASPLRVSPFSQCIGNVNMKISVVIPSKNGLHHLKDCLPSIITAANKAYGCAINIMVVDDNSTDGTFQHAPILFPEVTFLQNSKKGVCSARNFGVKYSPCDWICFLDNDVFVDEDFFNTSQKYLQPGVFCVTCAGYAAYPKNSNITEQLDGIKLIEWKRGFPRFTKNIYNDQLPKLSEYPSWGVQGAYFFCNRARFDELNGFDELFDPYMLEETDLVYRGLKRGWKIVYARETQLRHKCGSTIASKTNTYTKFLSKRNRILFVWKNIHSFHLLFQHWFWIICRFQWVTVYHAWKQWKKRRAVKTTDCEIIDDYALLKCSKDLFRKFIGEKL